MTRRRLLPVAFIAALGIVVLVVGPLVASTLIRQIQTREGGWNEATLPDADGAAIYALAPIDGKTVAFGAGVWTTTDGLAWERVATQEQVGHPGDYNASVAHARGITIISLDALIRISGDLRAWTDVDIDPNATVVVKWVVAGGPGFLAFGSRAEHDAPAGDAVAEDVVWSSVDGQAWRLVGPSPIAITALGGGSGSPLVVATASALFSSADGTAWTHLADLPPGFSGLDIVVTSQTTVVSGCVREEDAHRSSPVSHPVVLLVGDGRARLTTLPERADPGDVITPCAGALAATDSGFLAGGGDVIGSLAWSSEDAVTWTMIDPDAPSALKGLQCGDLPPCIQWARVTAIAVVPGGRTVAVGRGDDGRSRAWWITNP